MDGECSTYGTNILIGKPVEKRYLGRRRRRWEDNYKIFVSLALQPPWALASAFQFHDHFTYVGLLGRVIGSSQGLYLNTGQHKHRINAYTHQTSMPCVGFEPMISASERAKIVHTLDRSATVTGTYEIDFMEIGREVADSIHQTQNRDSGALF
jgi:hypothetical protein